jgi:hypothetical protein
LKIKTLLHFISNIDCESTFKKKVGGGFLHMIAKFTPSTIWPLSLFKPIRRPNFILDNQPSKGFAFWRRPRLPNQRRHGGFSVPQELHAID